MPIDFLPPRLSIEPSAQTSNEYSSGNSSLGSIDPCGWNARIVPANSSVVSRTRKSPNGIGLGPFLRGKYTFFKGVFSGLRGVGREGLDRVMIDNPRRNSLTQNTLYRHTTDHERCKRGGHQWVFGHCGWPERRESLHFSTCTVPPCGAIGPARRAATTADPNDSPVNGPFPVDNSLLLFSQPNAKPSHGGPACVPTRETLSLLANKV